MQSTPQILADATTRPAARTLDVESLTVRYGATLAVDDVTLAIKPREVIVDHADQTVKPTFHIASGDKVHLGAAGLGSFCWEADAAGADGLTVNEPEELLTQRSAEGCIGWRPILVVVIAAGVIGHDEERRLGALQPLPQGSPRQQIGRFAQVKSRQ